MHPIWSFVTDFGDTAVTVPLALLMAVFLFAARQFRLALGWCLAIVGCAGTIAALKLLLNICGYPMVGPALASPSGHTAMSAAVYGGFAAVLGTSLARPGRDAVIAGAATLMLAIAASRAVLDYHSPLEVAVGLGVGGLTLAGIVALVAYCRPGRLPMALLAAAAFLLALVFHGDRWPAERAIHRVGGWLDLLHRWCA
jgi:membrane-associated phospholipid phosphatase